MTSFIAARGSGRSTNFIPAVPAAWSVTTIAFMIVFSAGICLFKQYRRVATNNDKLAANYLIHPTCANPALAAR
jgi:hypothetical protein